MFDKITIGIKVKKNDLSEQIDVDFVRDTSIENVESFYNLENDYLDKRDITINSNKKQVTFDVFIEFAQQVIRRN